VHACICTLHTEHGTSSSKVQPERMNFEALTAHS
jgi:hypothetical protein